MVKTGVVMTLISFYGGRSQLPVFVGHEVVDIFTYPAAVHPFSHVDTVSCQVDHGKSSRVPHTR